MHLRLDALTHLYFKQALTFDKTAAIYYAMVVELQCVMTRRVYKAGDIS